MREALEIRFGLTSNPSFRLPTTSVTPGKRLLLPVGQLVSQTGTQRRENVVSSMGENVCNTLIPTPWRES